MALLGGCATKLSPVDVNYPYINLTSTPFFPQSDYQCGPAALSTLLVASGITVTPDDLVDQVYIPQKKGSLQIEMIATTRQYGRIPYQLSPQFSTIIAELKAGRPVLVMQNLGFRIKPVWHYAVVIGFDPVRKTVILRSAKNANTQTKLKAFLRSWQAAGYWAFVALKPGELPVEPDFDHYFTSVNDMAKSTSSQAMHALYLKTSQQFAEKPIVWFALANSHIAQEQYTDAVHAYLKVLKLDSKNIAAMNNLAYSLAKLSCYQQALEQAQRAVRLSSVSGQFKAEAGETLNQIKADMQGLNDLGRDCNYNLDPESQ